MYTYNMYIKNTTALIVYSTFNNPEPSTKNLYFNYIINQDITPIYHIINPAIPYILCDHFLSKELDVNYDKGLHIINFMSNANDLLQNKNYEDIKNLDIITIHMPCIEFFCKFIFPIIVKKNIRIIIITASYEIYDVDLYKYKWLLTHPCILLWISHDPIFSGHPKFMLLPFGLNQLYVHKYIDYVKLLHNNEAAPIKNTLVVNQYSTVHNHLPINHIRRKYPIFGEKSGRRLPYNEYLEKIATAKFMISTSGDRPDCFRHYECIGLDTLPISDITPNYIEIFGSDMIFSKPQSMKIIVKTNNININYHIPNKDILTVAYWIYKINNRITELLSR